MNWIDVILDYCAVIFIGLGIILLNLAVVLILCDIKII